jgi:hypothetical protein
MSKLDRRSSMIKNLEIFNLLMKGKEKRRRNVIISKRNRIKSIDLELRWIKKNRCNWRKDAKRKSIFKLCSLKMRRPSIIKDNKRKSRDLMI